MTDFEFDVALSFAGEDRAYVEQVAQRLKAAGVSVFYDAYEANKLWGEDLTVRLDEVYRQRARYAVPFISRHYAEKVWPRHEFRSALARAVEEKGAYILPVRLDDTELPGLRSTIAYLDGRALRPAEIADHVLAKLGRATPEGAAPSSPRRLPSVQPPDFNPYAEAERVVEHVRQELTKRAKDLESRGFGVHAQVRNERFMLRVMRSGATIYGLDIWIGGSWGDNTICFGTGTRLSGDSNSTNATGTIEWDRERGVPIVKIFNMSLLREMGRDYRLTGEELADELWEAICDHLERTTS